jgi:hypothetical protein
MVVEVVVQLPRRAAKELLGSSDDAIGIEQFSDQLIFLQELDNVLPQNLSAMVKWLEQRVARLPRAERNEIERVVSTALRQCLKDLRTAMKLNEASKLTHRLIGAFTLLLGIFTKASWVRRYKLPKVDQSSVIARHLSRVGALNTPKAQCLDLYVAGHTHATLQQEFSLSTGRRMTYLNTGTWRRVLTPARSLNGVIFQSYYQETLLCVNRLTDRQEHGRYEFLRYVRGV